MSDQADIDFGPLLPIVQKAERFRLGLRQGYLGDKVVYQWHNLGGEQEAVSDWLDLVEMQIWLRDKMGRW